MKTDKEIESDRYEARARNALEANSSPAPDGASTALPPALRAPYHRYAQCIREAIEEASCSVLEIGAGTGMFSATAVATGARVVATDISMSSLELLRRRLCDPHNLETRVADMEALPFEDAAFDVVLCAGSLSYGDNDTVMNEIFRVLKPGGRFVCVDSLDHNPVYRFNRWIQYLRGRRTRSTIARMPTLRLIRTYETRFGRVQTRFFGAITWLAPLLGVFLSPARVGMICDRFDAAFKISRSAFKFVMVAEKSTDPKIPLGTSR